MLQGMGVEDSLSNLTSAISNETSITSSSNVNEMGGKIPHLQQYNPSQQPPPKKRRNLPGNPDPDAEVVALSPHSLMATNRFVCEICNKGFQRDQNLQLHRRGHNLPWKLKQRSKLEVIRKKVYVCPEPSCVHHDPSRALGDLTGIKKHFSRKHGEKKWKCEKCSKRYAVQSDWKAHSKICGTREYRCDCGTLFSRRDSFITHRAFCDALAEESSRSMAPNLQTAPNNHPQIHGFHHHPLIPHLKQETLNFSLPPWLSSEPNSNINHPIFAPIQENHPNPNPSSIQSALFPPSASLMSATALLQKAAQMGVTMSSKMGLGDDGDGDRDQSILSRPHHHVGAPGFCATSSTTTTAGLPSREEMGSAAFVHGLAAYGGKLANLTAGCMEINNQENVNLVPSTSGFDAFNDSFNGIFSAKRTVPSFQQYDQHLMSLRKEGGAAAGGGGDGLTRDFLGLRAFPHRDFSNMAGFDQMGSSSSYDQNQAPWQS